MDECVGPMTLEGEDGEDAPLAKAVHAFCEGDSGDTALGNARVEAGRRPPVRLPSSISPRADLQPAKHVLHYVRMLLRICGFPAA